MTTKTPTANVDKSLYLNYYKKTIEFRDTMRQALAERRWNAASLTAIHAGISGNDALLVYYHGKRSISQKHDDAIRLLKSLMNDDKAIKAANHFSKLIYYKNLVEYESRLFTHDEAYTITKHAERFLEYVESMLPKD